MILGTDTNIYNVSYIINPSALVDDYQVIVKFSTVENPKTDQNKHCLKVLVKTCDSVVITTKICFLRYSLDGKSIRNVREYGHVTESQLKKVRASASTAILMLLI